MTMLTGPRQATTTTLARTLLPEDAPGYSDLDDPARLEDPPALLEALDGLMVIDAVQRRPDLLPILRV
ncbi:MAG: hypothetical protein U0821_27195 [Chloroflexota bacterium]